MAGKFDITKLMGGVPTQAEGPAAERETASPMLEIVNISIGNLIPTPDNPYAVDEIAGLKTSIEMNGVLQPLNVKPLEDGKYRILSGHRRYKACAELVAEGKTAYASIPCIKINERDAIKERILLIQANSTTRILTEAEKMDQLEELDKCYSILKKRDKLPGRTRDLVAKALNESATQIARYTAIRKNLTPELMKEFRAGRLGVSTAYGLSGLPEDKQNEAAAELQEKGGLSLNDVKEKKAETDPPPDRVFTEAETSTIFSNINRAEEIKKNATEPREYPETPEDFEEGDGEDEQDENETQDFVDMHPEDKAAAAIAFLNSKRFTLFAPGEDTRILDWIIEAVDDYGGTMEGTLI